MSDRIRIVVADDHPLYREGVVRCLDEDPDFTVVGQADDARSAIEIVTRERPDVVLLDLSMPGGGGMAALKAIRGLDPAPVVAMLTVSENDDDVLQALKAGALGYVLKGVGGRDLLAIVRDLAAGRSYVSPTLAAQILNAMRDGPRQPAHPVDGLSKREQDILRLVSGGLSNKEVGRELDLQEKTVKHYMTAILQKLHVRNRTEAALIARDHWNN
ncbi:MAG: response regulator transcription factor [Pseudooceanicola sp.]|nr:response regulator transcription factor [Pseudooceanicola sp.]